eukprot:83177-Alexandrium_andersonii.AAC.1
MCVADRVCELARQRCRSVLGPSTLEFRTIRSDTSHPWVNLLRWTLGVGVHAIPEFCGRHPLVGVARLCYEDSDVS